MSAVARWRLERRIKRESMRISSEIFPTLWENVRRKITSDNKNELPAYIKTRAAQLSQERVDALLQANSELSGVFATRLLLRSAERATDSILAAVASAQRSAA